MKTPKRFKFSHMRCQFCKCVASVDDDDNKNGWFACPYCGKMSKFSDEGFLHVSLYARWKRKNREARLRHAIRQEKRRLKNEEFRHRIYFQSTLDNMLQARTILFVNPLSGTYGHDVEGS